MHFQAQISEIKKIHASKKIPYISGNGTFWLKYYKNSLYFLKRIIFLDFLKRKLFLYFQKSNPAFFIPNPKKLKKTHRKRNFLAQILKKFLYFLIFLEMELSSSNIKKIGHIFSKESVSHISDKRTLHFSAQAIKIKELYPRKSYFTLGNENPPKMSCSF